MTATESNVLTAVPTGSRVRVLRVAAELRDRMRELGLREGAVIEVAHATHGGGRVLSVAGSRIALGSTGLPMITVEVLDEP